MSDGPTDTPPEVLAAGGVVLRDHGGIREVLVVHRPRYDDWSLPKGKLDDGETFEDAAVRELEEETGVRGRLLREIEPTRYRDRNDRPKRVRWWVVEARRVDPRPPDDEIDQVRWVPVDAAADLLTYPGDLDLLEQATMAEPATSSVLVVRHTHAGDRDSWTTDDRRRPLSAKGRRQAEALVAHLDLYAITRIVSSPYDRCVQSVEPLAAARGLTVDVDERLAEGEPLAGTLGLLREVGSGAVLCSHGDIIADLVQHLIEDADDHRWKKGSTWALTLDGRLGLHAARYLEPPA